MMPDPYVDDVEDKSNKVEPTEFEFQQSADIAELSQALCKAQGAMKGAVKDSANPFFKSKYADLSAVWDDIRAPFFNNGISVIQMPAGGTGSITVITQLTHTSGQWIRSRLTMTPVKISKGLDGEIKEAATKDPQSVGSCITYARRYALAAMAGVYQIDDDGNMASRPTQQISPEPVDMKKVQEMAAQAREVVEEDSEDYSKQHATDILENLTNDERIAMQGILKGSKPEGSGPKDKTYYSCFRDHLKLEKEWLVSEASMKNE